MAVPLICLAFGSIFIGYVTRDMFIGLGTDFFGNSIFVLPKNQCMVDSEFIPTYIKLVPLFLSAFGGLLSFFILSTFGNPKHAYDLKMDYFGNKIYKYLNKKWYVDQVYNEFIVVPVLNFGYRTSFKLLDRNVIEFFGPFGISSKIAQISQNVSLVQSGLVYHYAFLMLVGVTFAVAYICLWDTLFCFIDPRLYGILIVAAFNLKI